MSQGYQYTIIIGNVGRDPELRYLQSGVAVCDFTVAVSRKWNDKNTNEPREKTTWFVVKVWRGLAETANQYVRKGAQIMVTGDIDASAYTSQDGEARASLELTAQNFQLLGGKRDEQPQQHGYPANPEDMPF